jgi:hypothetical protein
MARNIPGRPAPKPEETVSEEAPGADASGESSIAEPAQSAGTETVPAEVPPVSRKFVVVRGANIMYGGCLSYMPAGKIVMEHAFDCELLRRQGVVLEQVEG